MILRCDNPHPHFKDRKCNAKVGATSTMPGLTAFVVVCHRCSGPIPFEIENMVQQEIKVSQFVDKVGTR